MKSNIQSINALRQDLGGTFHVVPKPDHPMLLTGPDLLIGGEGKLTAVLFIDKGESRKSLDARVMAIRLAMPSNTKLLAVVTDDTQLTISTLRNFDETLGPQSRMQQIARYAISDARPVTDLRALAENKRIHSEKSAFAMLLAMLRRKRAFVKFDPGSVILELSNTYQSDNIYPPLSSKRRRLSTHVQGSRVTSLTSRTHAVQQLRTLCDSGLLDSYDLDTGVPYQRPNSNLNILLVEDWPTVRYDPEKPIRSAAFGCWIMATSMNADDVLQLIERSTDPRFLKRLLQHA